MLMKLQRQHMNKAITQTRSEWEDGDYEIQEFPDLLNKRVPNIGSEIFAFDRTVFRYFDWNLRKPYTYSIVNMMGNISFIDCPVPGCDKKHCEAHCSEL